MSVYSSTSAPFSSWRLFLALLLQAVPVPFAFLLIAVGLCSFAASAPWCLPDGRPVTLPGPFNLMGLTLLIPWGLGFLMLPRYRRAFFSTFAVAILVNGIAVPVVGVLWLARATLEFHSGRSTQYSRPYEFLAALAFIGWGVLMLIAVAVICRRTWRLVSSRFARTMLEQ